MKVLEPSEEMVLAAESDIPAIGNMAYEKMEYPIGLFIQAEMDENILKIVFFVTDILKKFMLRFMSVIFPEVKSMNTLTSKMKKQVR